MRLIIVIFALFLMPRTILAYDNYILSMQVGGAFPHTKAKLRSYIDDELITREKVRRAGVFDLSISKRVYDNIFLDIEYTHSFNHNISRKNVIQFDGVENQSSATFNKITTDSFFVNSSYQFRKISKAATPYLTAGAGISRNKSKDVHIDVIGLSSSFTSSGMVSGKATNNFAWQIGCGLLLPVNEFLSLNISYKFRDLGEVRTSKSMTFNGVADAAVFASPFVQSHIRTSNVLIGFSIIF